MRLMIYLFIAVGGTLGGWLGTALDNGNWFGAWSIILSAVGALAGIWVGYKAGGYLG